MVLSKLADVCSLSLRSIVCRLVHKLLLFLGKLLLLFVSIYDRHSCYRIQQFLLLVKSLAQVGVIKVQNNCTLR